MLDAALQNQLAVRLLLPRRRLLQLYREGQIEEQAEMATNQILTDEEVEEGVGFRPAKHTPPAVIWR